VFAARADAPTAPAASCMRARSRPTIIIAYDEQFEQARSFM